MGKLKCYIVEPLLCCDTFKKTKKSTRSFWLANSLFWDSPAGPRSCGARCRRRPGTGSSDRTQSRCTSVPSLPSPDRFMQSTFKYAATLVFLKRSYTRGKCELFLYKERHSQLSTITMLLALAASSTCWRQSRREGKQALHPKCSATSPDTTEL